MIEDLQEQVIGFKATLEKDEDDSVMPDPVLQGDALSAFNLGQMADIERAERVDAEGFPDEPGATGEAEGAGAVFPPSMAGQNGGTDDIGSSGEAMVKHVVGRLEAGSPDEKCLSDASISAEPQEDDSQSSSGSGEPPGTAAAAAALSADGNEDDGSLDSAPDHEPTEIPGPAPAPENIRATATAEGAVVLTWNALEHQDITGYEISRMTGHMGRGAKVSTVAGRNNTVFKDNDKVRRGARHTYRVRGVGENGPGEWSDMVIIVVEAESQA